MQHVLYLYAGDGFFSVISCFVLQTIDSQNFGSVQVAAPLFVFLNGSQCATYIKDPVHFLSPVSTRALKHIVMQLRVWEVKERLTGNFIRDGR